MDARSVNNKNEKKKNEKMCSQICAAHLLSLLKINKNFIAKYICVRNDEKKEKNSDLTRIDDLNKTFPLGSFF